MSKPHFIYSMWLKANIIAWTSFDQVNRDFTLCPFLLNIGPSSLIFLILSFVIGSVIEKVKRMNKGAGSGPTAAAAAAAAQKQKTLMQRVETDIASIVDNFSQLVNVARVFYCLESFLFFIITLFPLKVTYNWLLLMQLF